MAFTEEVPKEQCISVIVPIYNTEQYLPACIESILNQTYKNLEIILVDDGSTDRSGEICDEYELLDQRIKVIHKQNGGNTSARKAGLAIASGAYIGFLDSDDWLDPDMYEVLRRTAEAEKADLVTSGIIIEHGEAAEICYDGVPFGVYQPERMEELRANMIPAIGAERCGIHGYYNSKLFKKEYLWPILRDMDDKVQFAEDTITAYIYICTVNRVVVLNQAFCHYRQRSDSLVHAREKLYLSKINAAYECFQKQIRDKYNSEALEGLIERFDRYIFWLCLDTPNRMFGRSRKIPTYSFPFGSVAANSKLILYGAGVVGQSYYDLIQWTNAFQVVGWIDKNYEQLKLKNVSGMEALHSTSYDYIIISLQSEKTAEQVRDDLQKQGVPASKILWFEPRHLFGVVFQ